MKQSDKPRPTISPPIILFTVGIMTILAVFFYKQTIRKEAITIDYKLLSRSFKGSTLEINAVPVIDMGMNSGRGKEFISLFDCGNYGILISDNKEIFRKAKENNRLTVYFGNNDYKILDI